MCYYDYDDYCEPSEEELFFDELKEKFKSVLNADVKNQLDNLQRENQELKEQLAEYKAKEDELREKEWKYNWAVKDLKKKVEDEFYNKTIIEALEKIMDESDVWYAERIGHERPKCNLCNEKRELVAEFANGETATIKCACAKEDYYYEPVISTNRSVKLHKSYKHWQKELYFKKEYRRDKEEARANEYYGEFYIEKLYDVFNDEVKSYHENTKYYSEYIGFSNKEACQQYCDWLNSKSKER